MDQRLGVSQSRVRTIGLRCLERRHAQRKPPARRHLGMDEIYLGKTTKFVTVVSNVETGEPLWFGWARKEEMDEFFRTQLSARQRQRIEAACVDMWAPCPRSVPSV